jgi:hypothetical protein
MTRCARCFAPAVDTAVIVMDRRRLEVDLCEDHVRNLLLGARSLEPKEFNLPARRRRPR